MALHPCPHCGHPISEKAEKCPQCHQDPRLTPEQLAQRNAAKKAKRKHALLIGGICAAVVLIVGGTLAALFLPDYLDYRAACDLLEQQNYVASAEAFDAIGDFLDSAQQALESRYQYVITHQIRSDQHTYIYLTELVKAEYKDAAAIENEVYAWHVTVFPSAHPMWGREAEKYWFSSDEMIYFVGEVHGGNFDEKLSVDYRFDYYVSPYATDLDYSDDREYGPASCEFADGDNFIICWESGAETARYSTVKITFYNAKTNALLATSEVHIYS